MDHWESLIASRMRPCSVMPDNADPVRNNRLQQKRMYNRKARANMTEEQREAEREYRRRYRMEHAEELRERERSPKRMAAHKAWAQSPDGILSWEKRNKKWRTSEKGRETCRRKSLRFYNAHKDEPEFKAKKAEWGKAFRLRHVPGKLRQVDYTLNLHGETIVAHVLTTRRDAA